MQGFTSSPASLSVCEGGKVREEKRGIKGKEMHVAMNYVHGMENYKQVSVI